MGVAAKKTSQGAFAVTELCVHRPMDVNKLHKTKHTLTLNGTDVQ